MDAILKKRCYKASPAVREFLGEIMGTIVLIIIGIGCEAQSVLSEGKLGGFLSINIGAALGVTFGIYWSLGVSGGHLNPAVTLANVMAGRLPLRKLPIYWSAQVLGTFIASAVVFFVYKDLLFITDDGKRTIETAKIWTTYPHKGVTHTTVFIDQIVGTGLLIGAEFALCDKRSRTTKASLMPAVAGLLVLAIGTSFGTNCGYGINPSRDLIPRVFTSLAGWKEKAFTFDDYYFWVPLVGQVCGAVIGALTYLLTVEMHHPAKEEANILTKVRVHSFPLKEMKPLPVLKMSPSIPDVILDIAPNFVYNNPPVSVEGTA